MAFEYRTKDGDVLDKLCAQLYRRDDMMGRVLDANQHLLGYGCVLPRGIKIVFPDAPTSAPQTTIIGNGLWGNV